MLIFAFLISVIWSLLPFAASDAWNPVRHETEEKFFKAKTHERSETVSEMELKISAMRARRNFQAWNQTNPKVRELLNEWSSKNGGSKRPNILFLLADDLGYGDLSVSPFTTPHKKEDFPCVEGGILTPQLERMASQGVVLTNFHASAPVCSPARASILTGLYSWRMTAMNAFELGRDPMQRNGFLPQIVTIPELLREQGYYTVHSGKWHLGGMREEQRIDRVNRDQCSRPSPNQHGFEEYISELDGPESPRYTFLLRLANLHTQGHRHLLKNDVPMPIIELGSKGDEQVLSDREAEDAISYMRYMKAHNPEQPWFMQVWFNAPHGPWEILHSGEKLYNEKYNKSSDYWKGYNCIRDNQKESLYRERWYYKTMVSAMDVSIGKLLDALKELQIEEDTLVVFTSDNGNELGAGAGGIFREGKRSLMEGGVRVPLIASWKGHIPKASYSSYFGAHTDLLPTFLEAAGIKLTDQRHFDGVSLLPVLLHAPIIPKGANLLDRRYHVSGGGSANNPIPGEDIIKQRILARFNGTGTARIEEHDRVFLWHKDTDPYSRGQERVQSGGYYENIKILTDTQRVCLDRIFDMKHDPFEANNLLGSPYNDPRHCALPISNIDKDKIRNALLQSPHEPHAHCDKSQSRQACRENYFDRVLARVWVIVLKLTPFVEYGNKGHLRYLSTDVNKATCDIPVASQSIPLRFRAGGCKESKSGCSVPEY